MYRQLKKITAVVAALALLVNLTACEAFREEPVTTTAGSDAVGAPSNPTDTPVSSANYDIVTTVFPLYDWTLRILGSNPADLSVKYLLDSGVDLHNYTPSIQDIAAISTSSLFLWVGGKSDAWVLNAMANPQNPNRRNVPVMRLLTVHETQVFPIDGVVPGEVGDANCCGGATHDEHVWLSIPFAIRFVERIAEELAVLDPANEPYYREHAAEYIAELTYLDGEFRQMVQDSLRDTILVVDRFPFLYMTLDYELNFMAAFDGCFAATEISLQRQAELIRAANDHSLDSLVIINNYAIANAVAHASGRDMQIVELQDFQSVSTVHIADGFTYYDGMRHNLEALRTALN
jgi:zinc transport system substrate-binding protein